MMGLAYLAAFVVYLIISLVVVHLVASRGKTWKSRLLLGVIAALVMYNLVFWDYLPTKWVHEYYCKKESGFWVYKTAEQWRKENPDVVVGPVKPPEGMVLSSSGKGEKVMPDGTRLVFTTYRDGYQSLEFYNPDGSTGYWLNDRFYSLTTNQKYTIFNVNIHEEKIVDADKQQNMFVRKSVYVNRQNDLKFWLHMRCGSGVPKQFLNIDKTFFEIGATK